MKKFSIIIPVYNVESYLIECVNSVLKQDYKNYEILLIDDGSTDNSGKICEELAKNNEPINVYHKKNGGLASARNEGIKVANGEYIIFLDSDDYWNDDKALSKFANILDKQDLDVLVFGVQKYYEKTDKYEKVKGNIKTEDLPMMLKKSIFKASACNKIVKLSLIKKFNMEFPLNMLSEDITWCEELINICNKFYYLDDNIYIYRQREKSITHSGNAKHIFDILKQCEAGIEKYKTSQKKDMIYAFLAYEYCAAMYCSTSPIYKNNYRLHMEIKKYREILNYGISKKVCIIRKLNNILGFEITYKIIKIFFRIKNRQK